MPADARGARHLYVHLPFCSSRCGYCAFVVEVGALDRRDAYLDALLAELELERGRLGPLESVFLGGGTPTLMRPRRLARLMERVRPLLAPGAEVTVEANPETVDRAAFDALLEMGVTRVSLGVQSFQPHVLEALDRQATADQAREAVACARRAGFRDIGIDLLFGVPGQTPADLARDLAEALEAAPDTAWATGTPRTIWAGAWGRSARSPASVGATPPGCRATSMRWAPATRRRAPVSISTATTSAASAGCWGCASSGASAWPGRGRPTTRRPATACNAPAWWPATTTRWCSRGRADSCRTRYSMS